MTLQLPDGNVIPRRLSREETDNWTREQFEEHRKCFESVQRNLDEVALQFPVHPKNMMPVAGTQRAHVSRNTTQAISNVAWTAVGWTTVDMDTAGMHSGQFLVTPEEGLYFMAAQAVFQGAAGGDYRGARIANGAGNSICQVEAFPHSTINCRMSLSRMAWLPSNYSIQLQVWQDSGGNLNLVAEATGPFLQLIRIA